MKCKELIEELNEYNPDAEVTLTYSEDIHLSYICSSEQNEFTKKNTPFIFIEPCDYEDC